MVKSDGDGRWMGKPQKIEEDVYQWEDGFGWERRSLDVVAGRIGMDDTRWSGAWSQWLKKSAVSLRAGEDGWI